MEEFNSSEVALRVLQFTDTHIFGAADGNLLGVDTAATFSEIVTLAHKHRGTPDFYLLTGDLSHPFGCRTSGRGGART